MSEDPSLMIDQRIAELDDWRGETLERIRELEAEVDFLGKASAYFAKKTQRTTPSTR